MKRTICDLCKETCGLVYPIVLLCDDALLGVQAVEMQGQPGYIFDLCSVCNQSLINKLWIGKE